MYVRLCLSVQHVKAKKRLMRIKAVWIDLLFAISFSVCYNNSIETVAYHARNMFECFLLVK